MKMIVRFAVLLLALSLNGQAYVYAEENTSAIKEDPVHVNGWNKFADSLYKLHKYYQKAHTIRTEESTGGYASNSMGAGKEFYREVKYFDANSGRLLSRIKWERENPDTIHVIEVFAYDTNGTLARDYLAAFLPGFRNAPVQTLINLHYRDHDLKAFRQFDASGDRIYEACEGRFFNDDVDISLEDIDINTNEASEVMSSEAYKACFGNLSTSVGQYIDPLSEIPAQGTAKIPASLKDVTTQQELDALIKSYTQKIKQSPQDGELYVKRGDAFFYMNDMLSAIDDYTAALKINDKLDKAYLGRGMALGRSQRISEGIADISVYLQRHPNDSHAYTKRGVRHIWNGDLAKAEKDLSKAIALNSNNAEARDDLGVIYAQRGELEKAINLFTKAISIDPSYEKAHHNLATAYHLNGQKQKALRHINDALRLSPNARESLLLKGEILIALGRYDEAKAIKNEADFLPEGNWHETFSIK